MFVTCAYIILLSLLRHIFYDWPYQYSVQIFSIEKSKNMSGCRHILRNNFWKNWKLKIEAPKVSNWKGVHEKSAYLKELMSETISSNSEYFFESVGVIFKEQILNSNQSFGKLIEI